MDVQGLFIPSKTKDLLFTANRISLCSVRDSTRRQGKVAYFIIRERSPSSPLVSVEWVSRLSR